MCTLPGAADGDRAGVATGAAVLVVSAILILIMVLSFQDLGARRKIAPGILRRTLGSKAPCGRDVLVLPRFKSCHKSRIIRWKPVQAAKIQFLFDL